MRHGLPAKEAANRMTRPALQRAAVESTSTGTRASRNVQDKIILDVAGHPRGGTGFPSNYKLTK
jgi:hypothetical protein